MSDPVLALVMLGILVATILIGFPVALKGTGPALLHKTERKALRLDIRDHEALAVACADLTGALGSDLHARHSCDDVADTSARRCIIGIVVLLAMNRRGRASADGPSYGQGRRT